MRTAVKYSIDNLLETIPIMNKFGIGLYIDKEFELEIVEFIRQNNSKFIAGLDCFLDSKRSYIYTNGPHCTKEFRFLKNGKLNGRIKLNSRIYSIQKGNKLILCYLDLHKKQDKVLPKVEMKLESLCNASYSFEESKKTLIEI